MVPMTEEEWDGAVLGQGDEGQAVAREILLA
jgi:hypothetical protein